MQGTDRQLDTIRTSLILMCGSPGIGKTTFSNQLRIHASKCGLTTFLISYDDLIDTQLESRLILGNEKGPDWKSARMHIARLVKALVRFLGQSETQQFETFLATQIDPILASDSSDSHTLIEKRFLRAIGKHFTASACNLIILDDLFYYASMRHTFYKLAVELACGYMSFCFRADSLDFLLERNATRDPAKRLDAKIIANVYEKFEYASENEWEREFTRDVNQAWVIQNLQCTKLASSFLVVSYPIIYKYLDFKHIGYVLFFKIIKKSFELLNAKCSEFKLKNSFLH